MATPPPASGAAGAAEDRGDTRARILEVARTRFVERGYEQTSLREIAEDLGITKAAVYYHFRSKDDILRTLLEPLSEAFDGGFMNVEDLGASADPVGAWLVALDRWLRLLLAHRDVFPVVFANRQAVRPIFEGALGDDDAHAAHHRDVDQVWKDERIPLHDRIRMAAALAALTGFDDWAPSLLAEVDVEVLETQLRATIAAILGRSVPPPT
jgi:AcrR family transcriptional regulator